MNRMTHSLVISSVLLTLSAGLMNVTAFAQSTQSNSAETQLCDWIVKVARPTLKRRGQPRDSQPAVYEERHLQVKCENPENSEAKIIQKRPENFASLRFVGLKAFPHLQAASLIRGEIPDFRSQRIPGFDVAEKGAAVLRDFLRTKGYFDAFVDVIRDEQFNSMTAKFINESPLQPGDVYKPSAYAAFITQLDQSGLFEPIDQDRDSDFRVDQEERVVSIRLKLRRRGSH